MGNNSNKHALESLNSVISAKGTYTQRKYHEDCQPETRFKQDSCSKSLSDINSLQLSRSNLSSSIRSSKKRYNKQGSSILSNSVSKDSWPIKQIELSFLPEFPLRVQFGCNSYQILAEVSSGSFGKVYKIHQNDSNQIYALKVLSKSKIIKDNSVQQVKEEVQIQKACGHHPFIVSSPFHWQSKRNLYIVTEFVEGGELHDLLKRNFSLPLALIQLYVCEIAFALDFLHNAGIIYRDLKPENILLDTYGHIQLIDFGLSKWLSYGNRTKTLCGTLQYMAPEVFNGQPYGHAADWWSLGVIACLMLTRKYPSNSYSIENNATSEAKQPGQLPIDAQIDVKSRDLLLRLLEVDPAKRLRSLRTLQTIAFYKNYNFDNVKMKKDMPSSRKMILNHVMSGLCTKMNRTKQLPADVMETPLNRCLNTVDITLLGVGHMVGAGIYVLTGTVAKDIAGPGIILSFLLAGLASLLSALCYAEFGTRVPKAGSAYVYTYISIGEFWAFVIGWNILLEHMIGAASVARAWSGYVDSLFGGAISNATISTVGEMHEQLLGRYPDVLASLVCLAYALLLGVGVKFSSIVNSFLTLINLAVMVLVIVVGFYYANEENWTSPRGGGFLPYGFSGVIAGAATCFYAFVGFDSIATAGEEAKNPSFSIPMATVLSMGIVTLGYILVTSALTLLVPYYEINPNAALPEAFAGVGMHWVRYVVSIGAICGMTTTLFGSLFSLPRCMYAMASDGLLFSFLGDVNSKTQLPLTNLVISGICTALIALVFDLEKLVEFMSIGTLLAYTIVSACVIILRYKPPKRVALSAQCLTPGSEMSGSTSGLTTPGSEIVPLTGTLRAKYGWLSPVLGHCEPGAAVTASVLVFTCFAAALCILLQTASKDFRNGIWWTVVLATVFVIVMAGCLLVIVAHHQNNEGLRFKVPLVPFVPALSILCNLEFMFHLNVLTWLRFFVWMILGMLVYFLYGIHHSKEGETQSTYSMLMTSSEATKEKWGSTTKTNVKGVLTKRKASTGDRNPILNDDELS